MYQYQYLLFLLRNNKNRKNKKTYRTIAEEEKGRSNKTLNDIACTLHTVIYDIVVRRMMHGCNTLCVCK